MPMSIKALFQEICCIQDTSTIDAHESAPPTRTQVDHPQESTEAPYQIADQEEEQEPEEEEDWDAPLPQPNINQTPYQDDFIKTETEPEEAVGKDFEQAHLPNQMEWFKTKLYTGPQYVWEFNDWTDTIPAN